MTVSLLAHHAAQDRVAYGAAGERSAAELLADSGAVAHALPAPTAKKPCALLSIRRDPYASVVALLAAWSRGYVVAVPPPDTTREGFLRLAQRPEVGPVIHDTASTAALPIAQLLAEAEPELRLPHLRFAQQGQLIFLAPEGSSGQAPLRVRGAELLREAALVGCSLALPELKSYACTVAPDTRYGWVLGVFWPLLCGGALLRDDPFDPLWSVGLRERALTPPVLISVPSHLRALARDGARPLEHVASVVSAGRPLTAAGFQALRQLGLRVLDLYAHARYGVLGVRTEPTRPFRPLLDVVLCAVEDAREPQAEVAAPHVRAGSGARVRVSMAGSGGFFPSGPGVERAEIEERVAWLDGVYEAALIDASTGAEGSDDPLHQPRWLLALGLEDEAPDDDVAKAIVARQLRGIELAELRCFRRRDLPDPADATTAVASFTGGACDLGRNRAGRHDRAGVLRLFGLGTDAVPLSWSLSAGDVSPDVSSPSDAPGVGSSRPPPGQIERQGRRLRVPSRYGYFAGHFTGYPILPGAAQLSEIVLPCVRSARPELGRLVKMARLKFQERILPDDVVEVHLAAAQDASCVDFSLRRGETVCASGRLWFEPSQRGPLSIWARRADGESSA